MVALGTLTGLKNFARHQMTWYVDVYHCSALFVKRRHVNPVYAYTECVLIVLNTDCVDLLCTTPAHRHL